VTERSTILALAGGVGSARFLAGLIRVADPAGLTVVVNTGDDERIQGLHISPDVDTVLYHLSGEADWERGWGVAGETFTSHERYRGMAGALGSVGTDLQDWFALGDRDLATHLLRARLLETGATLTEATDALRRAMGVPCRVLPMTDTAVRTVLATATGEALDFQRYFVQRRHSDEVTAVRYAGAAEAIPAPGVIDAARQARVLIVPPSNPLLSVAPLLAIPEIREAVAASGAARVAVSPIIGGRAIKGPADRILSSLGHEVSALGVARLYRGLVDVFVIDEADRPLAAAVESLGMRAVVCDTLMRSPEDAARLAKIVLEV
jgi:LPPG:FO 2-phospho-L-lactate transferase